MSIGNAHSNADSNTNRGTFANTHFYGDTANRNTYCDPNSDSTTTDTYTNCNKDANSNSHNNTYGDTYKPTREYMPPANEGEP